MLAFLALFFALCNALQFESTAFSNGASFPTRFACPRDNNNAPSVRPALQWGDLPTGTTSLAITFIDTSNDFVHWILYDIPTHIGSLPQDLTIPSGSTQGTSYRGSNSDYYGPCPGNTAHKYVFTLYALSGSSSVASAVGGGSASLSALQTAMNGRVLCSRELAGYYQRPPGFAAANFETAVTSCPAALSSGNLNAPFLDDFSFNGNGVPATYDNVNVATRAANIQVENSRVKMRITGQCVWWQTHNNAPFVYRTIDSTSFMLTTAVRARRATNPNSAINAGYHYAGVMIRNPASNTGPQNFVFVGTGYEGGGSVETKTTVNGSPQTIRKYSVADTDSEVRLVRDGNTFRLYSRPINADQSSVAWILRDTFTRNDMPSVVQVGFFAFSYIYNANNEFQAEFECFRVDGDISNETERVSNVCPLHLDMTTTTSSTTLMGSPTPSPPTPVPSTPSPPTPMSTATGIVIDDQDPPPATMRSGTWNDFSPETFRSHGLWANAVPIGSTGATFRWQTVLNVGGVYALDQWNSCYTPRSKMVPHVVTGMRNVQEQTAVVDQDCATGPHGMWSRLFSNLQFDAGATAAVSISAAVSDSTTGQYIGADAVRFVLLTPFALSTSIEPTTTFSSQTTTLEAVPTSPTPTTISTDSLTTMTTASMFSSTLNPTASTDMSSTSTILGSTVQHATTVQDSSMHSNPMTELTSVDGTTDGLSVTTLSSSNSPTFEESFSSTVDTQVTGAIRPIGSFFTLLICGLLVV